MTFFGGERNFKIETAEDLILALKGERGDVGPVGPAGKDAVAPSIEAITERVLKHIRVPKDGKDGVSPKIEDIVAEVVKLIPVPKDGKDGLSIKGDKGDPGVSPNLDEIVSRVLTCIRIPRDGRDGIDGVSPLIEDVVAETLKHIEQPKDGKDGKDGISPKIQDIVTETLKHLKQPEDGKDGKDAPFSTWVEYQEINFDTDKQDARSICTLPLTECDGASIKLFLLGKGLASNTFYRCNKLFTIDTVRKTIDEEDLIKVKRSHDDITCFLTLTPSGYSVVVTSPAGGMKWRGQIEQYRL